GPLLGLRLGGVGVGDELKFPAAQRRVGFSAHLRSIVAVEHLDLVCNGSAVRSLLRAPSDHADIEGSISLDRSGWCVLRASTDGARDEVLDNYVYATTSPVYVSVGGKAPRRPPFSLQFFSAPASQRVGASRGEHALRLGGVRRNQIHQCRRQAII